MLLASFASKALVTNDKELLSTLDMVQVLRSLIVPGLQERFLDGLLPVVE